MRSGGGLLVIRRHGVRSLQIEIKKFFKICNRAIAIFGDHRIAVDIGE
jgi:hypothetical protein